MDSKIKSDMYDLEIRNNHDQIRRKNIMTKSKNHTSKRTPIENRQFSCQLIQRYHGKYQTSWATK